MFSPDSRNGIYCLAPPQWNNDHINWYFGLLGKFSLFIENNTHNFSHLTIL